MMSNINKLNVSICTSYTWVLNKHILTLIPEYDQGKVRLTYKIYSAFRTSIFEQSHFC